MRRFLQHVAQSATDTPKQTCHTGITSEQLTLTEQMFTESVQDIWQETALLMLRCFSTYFAVIMRHYFLVLHFINGNMALTDRAMQIVQFHLPAMQKANGWQQQPGCKCMCEALARRVHNHWKGPGKELNCPRSAFILTMNIILIFILAMNETSQTVFSLSNYLNL